MAYEAKPNTGNLFKNDKKTSDNQPDYTGSVILEDGTVKRLAAWVKEGQKGKFFSLKLSDPQQSNQPQQTQSGSGSNDDLPF